MKKIIRNIFLSIILLSASSLLAANFITDYNTAGDYTYDSNKIEVVGGLATLKESLLWGSIIGYWKMDDTNSILVDSSSLLNNGVLINGATSSAGQVGNSISFDGANDYGVVNNIPAYNSSEITIAGWFNFPTLPFTGGIGIDKASAWRLISGEALSGNKISARVASSSGAPGWGGGVFEGNTTLQPNTWYHMALTVGNGFAKLYLNGVEDGSIPFTGNIVNNSENLYFSSLWGGSNFINVKTDEVLLFNKSLSSQEVTDIYNAGNSNNNVSKYPIGPTEIVKTAGDTDNNLAEFISFTETLGSNNQGNITYQLSSDGSSWTYWNGTIWTSATATQYNSAGVVASNIASFPTTSKSIYVKAFLISDGNQAVELDEININYDTDITAPEITLIGPQIITVNLNSTYTDQGATALDDIDGDITANIIVNNPVDTTTLGTYVITYDVSDSQGNNAITVTRQVIVSNVIVAAGRSGKINKGKSGKKACKDSRALNFSNTGQHDESLCKYNEEINIKSRIKSNSQLGQGNKCPVSQILTQNIRSSKTEYIKNGQYDWYTKEIVKEIKILQTHLNRLGFNSGPIDGIIGPITRGAIMRMQEYFDFNVKLVDGYVGPLTREMINSSCEQN